MLNFVGIANRIVQQELWDSLKYRYYLKDEGINTFYIWYYENNMIVEDRQIVFDKVYKVIDRIEYSAEIKELILYILLDQQVDLPQELVALH